MIDQTMIAIRIMEKASPDVVLTTVNWDDDTHYQSWEASLGGYALHLSRYLREDEAPSPIHVEIAVLDSEGGAVAFLTPTAETIERLKPLIDRLDGNSEVTYADGEVVVERDGWKVRIDVTVFPHEGTFASEIGNANGGLWFDKMRALASYDTVLRLPEPVGKILNSLGYTVEKAYYGV